MSVPYRKLVRDRIPEIIQAGGGHLVTRVLDEAGYRQALLGKLVEEAGEAASASGADLPGELADELEVLRALTAVAGCSAAGPRVTVKPWLTMARCRAECQRNGSSSPTARPTGRRHSRC